MINGANKKVLRDERERGGEESVAGERIRRKRRNEEEGGGGWLAPRRASFASLHCLPALRRPVRFFLVRAARARIPYSLVFFPQPNTNPGG